MISKELLSEVLGFTNPIKEIDPPDIKGCIYVWFTNQAIHDINIYELAHKCKKRALEKDICINSFYDHDGSAFAYLSSGIPTLILPKNGFRADTETEAIFKAIEWVMK